MVLPGAPAGNATSGCAGVEALSAARPPLSSSLEDGSRGAAVALCALVGATFLASVALRRTAALSVSRNLTLALFTSAGVVMGALEAGLADEQPCAASVVLWIASICFILASNVVALVLTLLIERYARLAASFERNAMFRDDNAARGGAPVDDARGAGSGDDDGLRDAVSVCGRLARFLSAAFVSGGGSATLPASSFSTGNGPTPFSTSGPASPTGSPRPSDMSAVHHDRDADGTPPRRSVSIQSVGEGPARTPSSTAGGFERKKSGGAALRGAQKVDAEARRSTALSVSSAIGAMDSTPKLDRKSGGEVLREGARLLASGGRVTDATVESTLRLLVLLKSERTSVALLGLLCVPGLVALVALLAAVEPYHGVDANGDACVGCGMYEPLALALALLAGLFLVMIARLLWLLRRSVDPYGVRLDTTRALASACATYLLYFALLTADPGDVDVDRVFYWQFLVFVGLFFMWAFQLAAPLARALSERRFFHVDRARLPHHKTAATSPESLRRRSVPLRVALADALSDPVIMSRFERYAERFLVVESVRFLEVVTQFRHYFWERAPEWRLQKARMIERLFIAQNAPLQVNLSDASRGNIERAVRSQGASSGNKDFDVVFDEAFADVMLLMEQGAWRNFLESESEVERPVVKY